MAVNQAHRTLWGRIVLGLFILAWGSASAQPCLMAMDLSDQPPVVAEHEVHAHHDSGHEKMPDCEHCPPVATSASTLCAQGLNADCGVICGSSGAVQATVSFADAVLAETLRGTRANLPKVHGS